MSIKQLAIDWNHSMDAFLSSNKTIETCHYPESHTTTTGGNTDQN